MKPAIIIVSQLDGLGPTGVETHFNQIRAVAGRQGFGTDLVTPLGGSSLGMKLVGAITRLLRPIRPEYAVLWQRWHEGRRTRRRLEAAVRAQGARHVVIYAQDPLSTLVARSACTKPNCRVVSVVHYNISEANEMAGRGLTSEGGALWRYLMRIERAALPSADQLIFVSEFMRRTVAARVPEIGARPQEVISNFTARPIGESGDGPMADMIAIGTLEPRKNQSFLLRVLAECMVRGKRYTLSLVGDGPDRSSLEALARELGVISQVRFLGFQTSASHLIPRHRVFVHAARMESQGIALIEALSYRRPILAPAVGGIPEVFTDDREGFYWNLDDPRGAADRLISVLGESAIWERMSAQAWKTFLARFHPDPLSQRWMRVLVGAKEMEI